MPFFREIREVGLTIGRDKVVGTANLGNNFNHHQETVLTVLKNSSVIIICNNGDGLLRIVDICRPSEPDLRISWE